MIITEKMIKELQRRVDVSYEEAERYLRRAGGNIDIAEAYAYKRLNSAVGRIFRELEKLINATLIYRIKLYKEKDLFLNLPVFYFILFVFIVGVNKSLFVGVVFIILSLISDCNIEITKVERKDPFSFYKTVDKNKVNKQNQTDGNPTGIDDEVMPTNKVESVELQETTQDAMELGSSMNQEVSPSLKKVDTSISSEEQNEDDGYYEVTIDK